MGEAPTQRDRPRRRPAARLAVAAILGLVGAAFAVYLIGDRPTASGSLHPARLPRGALSLSAGSAIGPPPSAAAPPSAAPSAEPEPYLDVDAKTLEEQRSALFVNMQRELGLAPAQMEKVRAIVKHSDWLGQGLPKVTRHPMTRAECREIRKNAKDLTPGDPRCSAPNMVPLYDPSAGEGPDSAKVCIDQYEFPDVPCEYPVVYVKANEAVDLCRAIDKRICDAHEWEGACAGALKPPEEEYAFGQRRMMMEYLHNQTREIVWAYGKTKDHSKCATGSKKSPGCVASGVQCGSNTYPAGAFPECQSRFGVFDQHGNAAEHMNLPLKPEELASRGGLGETEMKGSWFIFATTEAHIDDCRWRALMWHKSKIDDKESHRNYHLGFRCCRDIAPAK